MVIGLCLIGGVPCEARGGDLPSPCDPRENPAVCQVKIQRNDAMDRLAVAQGDLQGLRTIDEKKSEYWKSYVSHLPNIGALRAHLKLVCSWRGTMNAPTAQLCSWWREEAEHE